MDTQQQKVTAADVIGGITNVLSGESKPTLVVQTEVVIDKESIMSLGFMLLIVFTIIIILWAIARKLSKP